MAFSFFSCTGGPQRKWGGIKIGTYRINAAMFSCWLRLPLPDPLSSSRLERIGQREGKEGRKMSLGSDFIPFYPVASTGIREK